MKNIGDIFKQTKAKESLSKREKREEILFNSWRELMGKNCCSHTVRLTLKNGILYVRLDSQVWKQELMLKNLDKIAENMAKKTGYKIGRIRIPTGGNYSI